MARDVSSKISWRRPMNIINSVNKTKIPFLKRISIDYVALYEYSCFSYFPFFITSARYELNALVFFVIFFNWN